MKNYELTLLFNNELMEYNTNMKEVKDQVKKFGGKITKVENDGSKRLAYPILNQDYATYVCCEVELPDGAPVKLSNWLNIYDPVLRYLIVQCQPKVKQEPKQETGQDYQIAICYISHTKYKTFPINDDCEEYSTDSEILDDYTNDDPYFEVLDGWDGECLEQFDTYGQAKAFIEELKGRK